MKNKDRALIVEEVYLESDRLSPIITVGDYFIELRYIF
jgi:hypothetical protein